MSQNQQMLTQLNAQVDAGDPATRRHSPPRSTPPSSSSTPPGARWSGCARSSRERAAYIYRHADTPGNAVADIEHVQDISAGKKYAESATQTDNGKVDGLQKVSNQLDAQRKQLEDARAAQQAEKDRLQNAKDALEALTAHQKKLLDEAGAIPVMGDAELTPGEVTAWFEARNVKYRLSGGISIGDLVQLYFDEGKAEHVRPELAFAQSIIETGSFGNALDNNYAGIGACDSCQGEPAFPSPQEGCAARSSCCATTPTPRRGPRTWPTRRRRRSTGNDPVAAAQLYDTFFAKGRTPTWNVMGNGNWATDPGYSQKVLTVYFQMVSFAAKHS